MYQYDFSFHFESAREPPLFELEAVIDKSVHSLDGYVALLELVLELWRPSRSMMELRSSSHLSFSA
jgi:hypothetical protein